MLRAVASSPAPAARGLAHIPALDGLRGLAVLGVVLFHNDGWLRGGYLGVDLFFVLSGFLITSLLTAEVASTGRVDLAGFWVRRARRLFPALLLLMPAIAVYAALLARPDELAALRADALATLGYVANWRAIWSDKSYWELFAAPSPLEHTWSLAIEEQFYVLWPLLVSGLHVRARASRRALAALTLGLAIGSALLMLALWGDDQTSRVYFGTDTRAAAILLGATLAFSLEPGARLAPRLARLLDPLGLLAALGLGVAWWGLEGEAPFLYRGGFWLVELGAVVLIAAAIVPGSLVARVLALRPLVWLGSLSYGVYLWHWPVDCVLSFERTRLSTWPLLGVRLAVTFAIALASFHAVEQPIRRRGVPFGRPIWVVPAAFGAALAVVVVATRARPTPPPVVVAPAPVASDGPRWPTPFSVDARTLPAASELAPGTARVLVLGDSVAEKLGQALRYRQEEFGAFVAQRGVGNCTILQTRTSSALGRAAPAPSGGCAERWVADATELRPDVTLIVLGGGFFASTELEGKARDSCHPLWQAAYDARLTELLRGLAPVAGRRYLARAAYPLGRWRSHGILERVDCFNTLIDRVAERERVSRVDLAGYLCPTTACQLLSQGHPIRPDGLHPDSYGAEELARWTLGQLGLSRVPAPAPAAARAR